MRRPRASHNQLDLLMDYQPKSPIKAYAPERTRAATIGGSISRVLSESLKHCELSREQVAKKMSEFLRQNVSLAMLDNYTSEAKDEYIINLVRFIAFLEVTQDRAVLQHIAEMFGWAVVEKRHAEAIEYAELIERKEDLNRELESRRRRLKSGGVL